MINEYFSIVSADIGGILFIILLGIFYIPYFTKLILYDSTTTAKIIEYKPARKGLALVLVYNVEQKQYTYEDNFATNPPLLESLGSELLIKYDSKHPEKVVVLWRNVDYLIVFMFVGSVIMLIWGIKRFKHE